MTEKMNAVAEMLLHALGAIAALLCILLSAIYAIRPAGWDPITIWPFWAWAVPGLILSLLSISARTPRIGVIAVLLWLAATLLIAEEPRCVLRKLWSSPPTREHPQTGGTIRVATLNCAGGNIDAAAEPFQWEPDIILLQEAPRKPELQSVVSDRPGWVLVASLDTAILVYGELEKPDGEKRRRRFTNAAEAHLTRTGHDVGVIATHLVQPVLRWDIWRASTWQEASHTRHVRARQMSMLAKAATEASQKLPTIAGGDFNTPRGDSLFRPLQGHLRDAFAERGVGWPNTFSNRYPCSRIDQVWVSGEFDVVCARAVPTHNSDHRMVVVDLRLERAADVDMVSGRR